MPASLTDAYGTSIVPRSMGPSSVRLSSPYKAQSSLEQSWLKMFSSKCFFI